MKITWTLMSIVALFGILPTPACRYARAADTNAPEPTTAEKRTIVADRAKALRPVIGGLPAGSGRGAESADEIAAGKLRWSGQTVDVGTTDIDWSGSQVQHQEWVASLNRMHFLSTLASAYKNTGDERYAESARRYIESWMDSGGSYETGDEMRQGDSSLNIAIRLGNSRSPGWGGLLPTFFASPHFDDAFVERVLASIESQAVFLSGHLKPRGNWRVDGLDTLVVTALRFPFFKSTPKFLDVGVNGIHNALQTQFLPDGGYIERTSGYGSGIISVALTYLDLARLFPEADAHIDTDLLTKSITWRAWMKLFPVNDSRAPYTDPQTPEELDEWQQTIDDWREDVARVAPSMAVPDTPPLEEAYPLTGHVFARSAWAPGADYLAFDASGWGGPHSHLSRLSFVFRSGGRELIADPGILDYEPSNPFSAYGKSTAAHSTLNVAGANQSGADAHVVRTAFTSKTVLIEGSYQGSYWDWEYSNAPYDARGVGYYGDHDRILFWLRGEYILALDTMHADVYEDVRNVWQMAPMGGWREDSDSLTWYSSDPGTNLLVRMLYPTEDATMETFEGQQKPIRGWVGGGSQKYRPAPLVEFCYQVPDPDPEGIDYEGGAVSMVLLAPFAGSEPPAYKTKTAWVSEQGHLRHLALETPDGFTDTYAWSMELKYPVDDSEPFSTDGTFVWVRFDKDGKPVRAFVENGSYLDIEGKRVFTSRDGETQSRLIDF